MITQWEAKRHREVPKQPDLPRRASDFVRPSVVPRPGTRHACRSPRFGSQPACVSLRLHLTITCIQHLQAFGIPLSALFRQHCGIASWWPSAPPHQVFGTWADNMLATYLRSDLHEVCKLLSGSLESLYLDLHACLCVLRAKHQCGVDRPPTRKLSDRRADDTFQLRSAVPFTALPSPVLPPRLGVYLDTSPSSYRCS